MSAETPDTAPSAEPGVVAFLADASGAEEPAEPSPGPVATVAVGASAGGIEALHQLLGAMPPDTGCAFVVLTHLPPEHPSRLVQVLSGATTMRVQAARDGQALERDQVYVLPPGAALALHGGRLRLSPLAARGARPHPIDHFMATLAGDQHERAIGIVLSGTDGDGAMGVKAIKSEGGLTLAQLPSTAAHPGMPQSAVATGQVDRQLPPAEMAQALAAYLRGASLDAPRRLEETAGLLEQVLDVLQRELALDFHEYKQPMLLRRVRRRMGLTHQTAPTAYLQLLAGSRAECEALAADFLISVTEFFREPEAWNVLAREVLPELLERKRHGDAVRVWVPGCATGEEAYSLAMLLLDDPRVAERRLRLQIFATDLDTTALEVARRGCYGKTVESAIGAARLERFFTPHADQHKVRKALRDAVTFAPHNLCCDPPFSRLDVISCRNLLIYMQPPLQRRVLQSFHYGLVPDGVLALGKSETVAPLGRAFRVVSQAARIFARDGSLPARLGAYRSAGVGHVVFSAPPAPRPAHAGPDHAATVRDVLLQQGRTTAVLTNADGQALYFHGPLRRYLVQPDGAPTQDLFSMLDPGLRPQVRADLLRACAERQPLRSVAVLAADGQERQRVRIGVTPLPQAGHDDLMLVTFDDLPDGPDGAEFTTDPRTLRSLEEELHGAKRELRRVVEELEAANEELRVANEEAMSTNEELQSTNEELETSQEEVQSVNEELTTVNQQLQCKVEELEQTNDALSNLLASTSIPTLFLDRQLHIKRFTPAATRMFRLIDTDIDRPLTDIAGLDDTRSVADDARAVLETLAPLERETSTRDGRHYLRRTLPYRTQDDRIDGVVITLNDVSELKAAAMGMQRLAAVLRDASDAIVVHDLGGRLVEWNHGAESMYGWTADEARQRHVVDLIPEDCRADYEAALARVLAGEPARIYESRRRRRDGGELHVAASLSPMRDDAGRVQAVSLIERDVTPQKRAEAALRESEQRFRALADNAPVLIWMADADATMSFANHSFAAYTGLAADRLAGRPLADFVHHEDRARALGGLAGLGPRRESFSARLRLRREDGAFRWMQCSALVKPEAVPGAAAVVGTMVDIDALVEGEETLRAAGRHKDEFLAMLGHELRNPLAPIRNAAEVLRRVAPGNERLTWVHDVLVRQVGHVTRLVDDLLDISMITRGTMQLRLEPVDLRGVLERAVDDVRPMLQAKQQHFAAGLPAQPLWVEGDRIRLNQVFQNLLANAVKYSDDRGHVGLDAWRDEREIVVRIHDDGVGIAPEMQPRIFDLFVQDQRSLDRSQGGLGIGLALVRHLVDKHGGAVEARSAGVGRGSEFIVRLPLLPDPAAAAADASAAPPPPSGGRVLVVDDDRESGETLRMLLELGGFDAASAFDFDGALQATRRHRPQVVVMDIAMPECDGYELARRLRALPEADPAMQVVGLSGFGRPDDAERSRAEGFAQHFAKPVDPVELEAAIRELLAPERAASAPKT